MNIKKLIIFVTLLAAVDLSANKVSSTASTTSAPNVLNTVEQAAWQYQQENLYWRATDRVMTGIGGSLEFFLEQMIRYICRKYVFGLCSLRLLQDLY